MLFIDHHKPQLLKDDTLFNDGMGSNDNPVAPLRNAGKKTTPIKPLDRMGEKDRRLFLEKSRERPAVLLGQDLRRSEKGRLTACPKGLKHGKGRHQGLARADISEKKAIHRMGLGEVPGNLPAGSLLGPRQGKRGLPLKRSDRIMTFLRRNPHAARMMNPLPPEHHEILEQEELFEDNPVAGRIARKEKLLHRAFGLPGEMHLHDGRKPAHQMGLPANGFGEGVKGLPPKGAQDIPHNAAKDSGGEAGLFPVDRNDPTDMIGAPEPLLGIDGLDHRRAEDQSSGV